jgi:hypothetical protein
MSNEEIPLQERVTSYYSQLSSVAADLNAVSDELGKSIAEIDVALKKLNLGIATWVTIRSADNSPYDDSYWSRDIGYAKISSSGELAFARSTDNLVILIEQRQRSGYSTMLQDHFVSKQSIKFLSFSNS